MADPQHTIDALWPVAKAVASHIREWHIDPRGAHHQQFGHPCWDGSDYIAAAFAEPGVIEYRLKGGADVRIIGIEVADVKAEDIEVGPIEQVGPQKVVRAQVMSGRNTTLLDVQRELKYRDLQSKSHAATVAKEVGASIAAGLRQSVGYGSELYGIQGETELTLNIEASVKAAWEDVITTTHEHEMESVRQITEEALHETVVERVESVGPARQVIKARGMLKFGCRIHAPGHFVYHWDSMTDLAAALQGIETKSGNQWLSFYRRYPVTAAKLNPFRQTVYAESVKVREFEEASNVRVDIRSEPLNDKARLIDALHLIALKGEDPKLRQLAGEALKTPAA